LNLLYRGLGLLAAVGLMVATLILASVVLALVALIALFGWAWLWWRSRGLREHAAKNQGTVIEGEYRIDEEKKE
jgi:hypothetical protein